MERVCFCFLPLRCPRFAATFGWFFFKKAAGGARRPNLLLGCLGFWDLPAPAPCVSGAESSRREEPSAVRASGVVLRAGAGAGAGVMTDELVMSGGLVGWVRAFRRFRGFGGVFDGMDDEHRVNEASVGSCSGQPALCGCERPAWHRTGGLLRRCGSWTAAGLWISSRLGLAWI